jgi:hypothetical protein
VISSEEHSNSGTQDERSHSLSLHSLSLLEKNKQELPNSMIDSNSSDIIVNGNIINEVLKVMEETRMKMVDDNFRFLLFGLFTS